MPAVKKQKVTRAAHVDLEKTPLPKTRSAAKGAACLNPTQTNEVNDDEVEKSGVPLGMAFWGERKLDLIPLPKLLLALTENVLAQPPTSEKDNASWAKQMMLKTFKHRNYLGWKERLVAEQKAKK
uniref:Uncharacterized protein n=1 Tax=Chrysotila carterae TaxID=13221 RepID=A0A7S4C4Y9_CHRCT